MATRKKNRHENRIRPSAVGPSQTERTAVLGQIAHAEGLVAAPGAASTEAESLRRLLVKAPRLSAPFPGDMISVSYLANVLKAPRLLMQLLKLFEPALLQSSSEPLRVLYLGASKHEVFDQGRWFHLAFMLAGIRRRIEITAVGPEIVADPEALPPTPDAFMVEDIPPAVVAYAPMSLAEAVGVGAVYPDWDRNFDVAVMHHPGFIGHFMDWEYDDAWNDLVSFAKIPILGTSFDAADLMVDSLGLAIYGRPIVRSWWNPEAHFNPNQAQDHFGTRLLWGGVLWSTGLHPDNTEDDISQFQLQAISENRDFWELTASAFRALKASVSCQRVIPMQRSDIGDKVWVADQIWMDVATGDVDAFGRRLPATPLTRRVCSIPTCRGRLVFCKELLLEIAIRLGS